MFCFLLFQAATVSALFLSSGWSLTAHLLLLLRLTAVVWFFVRGAGGVDSGEGLAETAGEGNG